MLQSNVDKNVFKCRYVLRASLIIGAAGLCLAQMAVAEPAAPPRQVISLDLSGASARERSDAITSMAFQQREPLGKESLFWSWGLAYDHLFFENAPRFPVRQLQDFAFPFAIEYFKGSEAAASISIKPGFYFENQVEWRAWDIPVQAVTGIPISKSVNGVIGINAARFFHYPIPIFGVSWAINPQWRLDGVYPEPGLFYRVSPALETHIAGQLVGEGFRVQSSDRGSKLEYSAYRIGLGVTYQSQVQWRINIDSGYQIRRSFDFFENRIDVRVPSGPYLRVALEFDSH